jgi:MSHA biogenesis protein MshP
MRRHAFSNRLAMRRQRGVSIITAIFLLLLFAALAAYMVSMTTTADVTSAQDVQGERAYHAAQGGLEWGAYQILVPAGASCAAATPLPAPLGEFTVTVTCTASGPFNEAGNTFSVYRLTSLARNTAAVGSAAYVEREVYGSVSR